jgi:hypothetical protein
MLTEGRGDREGPLSFALQVRDLGPLSLRACRVQYFANIHEDSQGGEKVIIDEINVYKGCPHRDFGK